MKFWLYIETEQQSEVQAELAEIRQRQIILHYLDTNKEINSSIAAKLLSVRSGGLPLEGRY